MLDEVADARAPAISSPVSAHRDLLHGGERLLDEALRERRVVHGLGQLLAVAEDVGQPPFQGCALGRIGLGGVGQDPGRR